MPITIRTEPIESCSGFNQVLFSAEGDNSATTAAANTARAPGEIQVALACILASTSAAEVYTAPQPLVLLHPLPV